MREVGWLVVTLSPMGGRLRRKAQPDAGALIPSGLRVTPLAVGDETLLVFSFPTPSAAAARLTPAEGEVASLLLEGLSNAEIARRRGTTPGTVGKQIESIYRKLEVQGRREFAALMTSGASRTR